MSKCVCVCVCVVGSGESVPRGSSPTVIGTIVGVLVLLATLVVVVLVLGKRRKIRAKIWRPHSPTETDHTSPTSLSNGTGVDGAVAASMTK